MTREEQARARALRLYPYAWGVEYDPEDESSRIELEQLVRDELLRMEAEVDE
jgi:hypothetical protein